MVDALTRWCSVGLLLLAARGYAQPTYPATGAPPVQPRTLPTSTAWTRSAVDHPASPRWDHPDAEWPALHTPRPGDSRPQPRALPAFGAPDTNPSRPTAGSPVSFPGALPSQGYPSMQALPVTSHSAAGPMGAVAPAGFTGTWPVSPRVPSPNGLPPAYVPRAVPPSRSPAFGSSVVPAQAFAPLPPPVSSSGGVPPVGTSANPMVGSHAEAPGWPGALATDAALHAPSGSPAFPGAVAHAVADGFSANPDGRRASATAPMVPPTSGSGDAWSDCDPHAFFDRQAFAPDPTYDHIPYSAASEIGVYEGKWNMCSQRPLIELGRGVYRNGVVPRSYSFLGKKNLITPGFTLFGDFRTAVAANDNGAGDTKYVWANRLNLDFDLRLTATERIHAFWGPLDEDGRFTRVESITDGRDQLRFFEEFDDDFDTFFFEGDLGYIYGGMTDQWAPFDLPFVAGKFPLLFQNGVWINDAVEGFAFTVPARNAPRLNWSNFDLTMFFLFDDIDSDAFEGDDSAADAYGANLFVDALGGYTEAGYAYLDDRTGMGRSYHNLTIGFTRRYRQRISNSVRVIVNTGQDPVNGVKTADGQLLLIENSLVSSNPVFYVPYFNVFAGFGRPRNLAGQSPLQNVGISFETDALTGFPKLDDTAEDTWGGAFGFNMLGPGFKWQWILEASMVQDSGNRLAGDQYAVGTRIQRSLNYAWLLRMDAMYGLRENADDISGVRAELRWKF